MLTFKQFFYLTEGQAENQAFAIVNNDQILLNQIKRISPDPKYLPIIAYFHVNEHIPIEQMQEDIQSYKRFVDEKKLPMLLINNNGAILGNQQVNWLSFTEKLHAIEGQIAFKNRDNSINDGEPIEGTAILSKNGFDVYEAHGRKKCIQYGKGYSFCISRPNNTLWQSYRDTRSSTFYFVFDRNRTKEDPLHVVVVDHTASGFMLTDATNRTGNIAEFGGNAESYIQYLESKGIPRTIFQHIEHSEEEKSDAIKLTKNLNLKDFIRLTHEEKSRFIGRGNTLGFDQFKYLVDNNLDDLIHQYATTGHTFSKEEFDLISDNTNLLKSYLRSRIIENSHKDRYNYEEYEIPYIKQHFSKEIKEQILKNPSLNLSISMGLLDVIDHAIDYLISKRRNSIEEIIDKAIHEASKIGNLDIIELLLKKSSNYPDLRYPHLLDLSFVTSAEYGKVNVVAEMISKGIYYFEEGLEAAHKNGHRDVVKLILDKAGDQLVPESGSEGALSELLIDAIKKGDFEIIDLIIKKATHHLNLNYVAKLAYRQNSEVADFLISKGAKINWGEEMGDMFN